ncbi:hypothetical protein HMI56_000079 [Coelomomyces lativittatus]|nr:hypothetical protein HMI56_000079 [Coelomomyces lativittatus]
MQAAFFLSQFFFDFKDSFLESSLPVGHIDLKHYKNILDLFKQSKTLSIKLSTYFQKDKVQLNPSPKQPITVENLLKGVPDVVTSNLPIVSGTGYPIRGLKDVQRSSLVANANLAGNLALYLSYTKRKVIRKKFELKKAFDALTIKTRIMNTASPIAYQEPSSGKNQLVFYPTWALPVYEQGAGIVNIQKATFTYVTLKPSILQLNDESHRKFLITIKNLSMKRLSFLVDSFPAEALQIEDKRPNDIVRIPVALKVFLSLPESGKCPTILKYITMPLEVNGKSKKGICVHFVEDEKVKESLKGTTTRYSGYVKFTFSEINDNKKKQTSLHVPYLISV